MLALNYTRILAMRGGVQEVQAVIYAGQPYGARHNRDIVPGWRSAPSTEVAGDEARRPRTVTEGKDYVDGQLLCEEPASRKGKGNGCEKFD